MRVLVIGGGGREHALAWKLAQSAEVEHVYVAPGNAGTEREVGVSNAPIGDIQELCEFARKEAVGLTVVGPEAPLADGLVDHFRREGLTVFGPTQAAARIESSKIFCKELMVRHGVPTADFVSFDDADAARKHLSSCDLPAVIKADGLAAGKGVVVAREREEAQAAATAMLSDGVFGAAGRKIIVEEFVAGEEASLICVVGGGRCTPLAASQDHKTRDDGDVGPNTGGMGAYSPAPVLPDELLRRALREVVEPTIKGMESEGAPFEGFLYTGLVVRPDGGLCVLEFNCRMGDPETQPILMRLKSDLAELISAACEGRLGDASPEWDARSALTVVMAAAGYPGDYERGHEIVGVEDAEREDAVKVFHAGTRMDGGRLVTAGGRVLGVTALGEDLRTASAAAYAACERIRWEGAFYRRDIGSKALRP